MSRPAQTLWNGNGYTASPLSGIPNSLDIAMMNLYDPAEDTPESLKAYRAKWDGLFKQ